VVARGKKSRAHAQGSIWTEKRARGRIVYVGQVSIGGRLYQRTLGDARTPGAKDGLTRSMAEARLRKVRAGIEQRQALSPQTMTLREAGERYLWAFDADDRVPLDPRLLDRVSAHGGQERQLGVERARGEAFLHLLVDVVVHVGARDRGEMPAFEERRALDGARALLDRCCGPARWRRQYSQ
jgi:hypothetical protein